MLRTIAAQDIQPTDGDTFDGAHHAVDQETRGMQLLIRIDLPTSALWLHTEEVGNHRRQYVHSVDRP